MSEYVTLNTKGLTFQLSETEYEGSWNVYAFGMSKTAVQQVPGCRAKRCDTGEDYYLDELRVLDDALKNALMENEESLTNKAIKGSELKKRKDLLWKEKWEQRFTEKKYFTASEITVEGRVVRELTGFELSNDALIGKEIPAYIASENIHKAVTKHLDEVRRLWKVGKEEEMCDELVSACDYFTQSIPLLTEYTNAQDQHLSHALHEMFDMLSKRLHVEEPLTYPTQSVNDQLSLLNQIRQHCCRLQYVELDTRGLIFRVNYTDYDDQEWYFNIFNDELSLVPGGTAKRCDTGEDYYLDELTVPIHCFMNALMDNADALFTQMTYFTASYITVKNKHAFNLSGLELRNDMTNSSTSDYTSNSPSSSHEEVLGPNHHNNKPTVIDLVTPPGTPPDKLHDFVCMEDPEQYPRFEEKAKEGDSVHDVNQSAPTSPSSSHEEVLEPNHHNNKPTVIDLVTPPGTPPGSVDQQDGDEDGTERPGEVNVKQIASTHPVPTDTELKETGTPQRAIIDLVNPCTPESEDSHGRVVISLVTPPPSPKPPPSKSSVPPPGRDKRQARDRLTQHPPKQPGPEDG